MDKDIKKLLRIEDEPFKIIDDITVHELLINDIISFMDFLKIFYEEWSVNDNFINLPIKSIYTTDNIKGDFRIMPCIINKDKKIKAVKIIGTNEENNTIKDKISVGKMLLIDWYDNYVYSAIDACVLSSFRTAAISVLAYSLYEFTGNISIIGTGRIGFYTAVILHKYLKIDKIYYNDIKLENRLNFEKLCQTYIPDLKIIYEEKIEKLNKNSESIFLCTDSSKSILNDANIYDIKFVSSIGADADNLSELDGSLIGKFSIITDSKQSTLLGDMKKWKEKKLLNEQSITELKDLIYKEKEKNQRVMFISTGVAVQDAIIGKFIYDKYVF